jgi:lipooligosaccharide transport system permease protein
MNTTLVPRARIIPEVRRPQRMIERSALVYKHSWTLIIGGFFEPLFYLLSMRVGVGKLVGQVTTGGQTMSYVSFVAPALLASSAMNGAVYDTTMNIFHKIKYARTYDAVLATPMTAADVALGEIGWAIIRGLIYSVAFLGVMAMLGIAHSAWLLAAIPICALIGFAFAATGMACTTFMRGWQDFEYVSLVMMPLFLFSGSFFPIERYPTALRWVVQATPLSHGVALVRSANSGHWPAATVGHVAYLLLMGLVGLAIASRRIERLLLK